MVDMRGNELKEGDLVVFVQKSSVSRYTDGTMDFGIISKFYTAQFDRPVCSVTLVNGKTATNVREPRIMKVTEIVNQYNLIKDSGDLQSFLNAMSIKK
jgi:hypothetical protein